jgi:hypothetical protein
MLSVSVIMNTYNESPEYLIQAINSYLNQYRVDIQLIISTIENDTSINIIKTKFPNEKRITIAILEKQKHPGKGPLGIFTQINHAAQYIKNDWVSYASSNDVALPKKLYNEINKCIINNKKVCYSAYYKTDTNLNNKIYTPFRNFNYRSLLHSCYITDCSIVKASLFKEMMPFDLGYENVAYWDLWIRIYNKYGSVFIYNDNPEFLYRISSNSQHIERLKNKSKIDKNIFYRNLLKNNYLKKYYSKLIDDYKKKKITYSQFISLSNNHSLLLKNK